MLLATKVIVCDIYLAPMLLVFVFDIFKYSAEATWMANIYNSFDRNILFSIARCGCGNCSVFLLQNISECYCCKELEGCGESLETDLVQQDFSPNTSLK